jgi:protein-S-isoprenylcysteine O-methyltransferase Ste14
MATTTSNNNEKTILGLDQYGRKGVIKEIIFVIVHFFILTISAGNFGWTNAWVFAGLGLMYKAVYSGTLIVKNPKLLNERGRFIKKDTKAFDKLFLGLMIPLNLLQSVIAGLDAGRFGWTYMPFWVNVLGALCVTAAFIFILWAMNVNTHFESTVRIQEDRDHRVCSAGPYRIIRHPGYAGALLAQFGSPLLLGSAWAFVPAVLMAVLFVVRTYLEDRTLKQELAGYKEYATATRYRLLPFVW